MGFLSSIEGVRPAPRLPAKPWVSLVKSTERKKVPGLSMIFFHVPPPSSVRKMADSGPLATKPRVFDTKNTSSCLPLDLGAPATRVQVAERTASARAALGSTGAASAVPASGVAPGVGVAGASLLHAAARTRAKGSAATSFMAHTGVTVAPVVHVKEGEMGTVNMCTPVL